MSDQVSILVSGQFACFARPEMKLERVSYDVITPAAARGILEAVYWKPEVRWVIDEIRVVNPIRFQTVWRNNIGARVPVAPLRKAMETGDVSQLGIAINGKYRVQPDTVLRDVAYVITATLSQRPGPQHGGMKMHWDIIRKRLRKGQCFNQPCLGSGEFPATVRLLEPGEAGPSAIDETRDLGFMLYDATPDHQNRERYFRATLDHGVVRVPTPNSGELRL